jgi:hypothetical protein
VRFLEERQRTLGADARGLRHLPCLRPLVLVGQPPDVIRGLETRLRKRGKPLRTLAEL